ncbi:tRNA 2'-phosphotransferase 1 isoform X2 [Scyliorhinus canicula]|uniref:tRNA 2'-phosphotransferase 1 isoform X2 n=1 Tax=Scyliorhinus canicula TaxID=7830 RepID=UPI0018F44039|nr:tRNA 2'-phosphotransferase 1 isoform X2 [Scyliorhinus canicula]
MEGGERGSSPGRGASRRQQGGRHTRQDPDVRLSKSLSYILRHGAAELGLAMGKDGFLNVADILHLPRFKHYSEQNVRQVVDLNSKQRFTLRLHPETGILQIRANQGHTIPVEELELIPISLEAGNVPDEAVHGTYLRLWPSIKGVGLRRMSRTHIHLATGLPQDGQVVSDGIAFYFSTNRVILTPGNHEGLLPPKYFEKVLQLKPTRCCLPLD